MGRKKWYRSFSKFNFMLVGVQYCNSFYVERFILSSQELLSFNHPHVMSSKLIVDNVENAVERIVESPLDELVILHLKYYSLFLYGSH